MKTAMLRRRERCVAEVAMRQLHTAGIGSRSKVQCRKAPLSECLLMPLATTLMIPFDPPPSTS
jgi:hypothetical protein